MDIVSQSPLFSSTLFPPNPPLLLAAPKIAGLLTATVPSSAGEQPPHAAESRTLHYTHAHIDELTEGEYAHFVHAAQTILDVGIGFMLGRMNEDALRAAEVVFHRAVGGNPPSWPLNPDEYMAEQDADDLDLYVNLPRRMKSTRERLERELDEKLAALRASREAAAS